MTELFINSKKVVISSGQNFKIVLDNVYFTKSSSYSYDIKLPLSHPANIAVFGSINRKDVKKRAVKYDALLIVNNRIIFNGSATIIDISETDISIQLLAGNSEFNKFFTDTYIDNLDLGSATNRPTADEYFPNYVNPDLYDNPYWAPYGNNSNYVYFPIYNSNADNYYNRMMCGRRNGAEYFRYSMLQVEGVYLGITGNHAVQPYLCFIIRLIIEKLGYSLVHNQIEETFLKNIFIANDKVTYEFAKTLPHWTVNKFFTEIENLFGCIVLVDERDKTVSIKFVNKFYSESVKSIESIIDQYQAEIDDENSTDVTNANIGYLLPAGEFYGKYRKIDNKILSEADVKEFTTIAEMESAYNAMDSKVKAKTLFECGGYQYIQVNGKLKQVNHLRDLIRDKDSGLDIELNIIPVEMMVASSTCLDPPTQWTGSILVMKGPHLDTTSEEFDIQKAIEGNWDKTESSESDPMYVGLNDGVYQAMRSDDNTKHHAWPWPYINNENLIGNAQEKRTGSLELYAKSDNITLGSVAYSGRYTINTEVLETFYFIDDIIPDPKIIYLINNKRYVCKSFELEVDENGFIPLKCGKMYELCDSI